MNRSVNSNFCWANTVTGALFIAMLAISNPMLNSDDDLYILYTLSGGYGNNPTNILHYYHGWHPVLFWPIAVLFRIYPNFNWYTAFLLMLQFISCINLMYIFLVTLKRPFAIAFHIMFFVFFGSILFLSLNHSNTSILLAISGCSSLLYNFQDAGAGSKGKINWNRAIISGILILISFLLRTHTLLLYVLLSLGMGLIMLPLHSFKKFVIYLSLLGLMMIAFTEIHKYYYESKIPHSRKEEDFRQSLFYQANHLAVNNIKDTGIKKVKNSFIESWFVYDSSFVSTKDIQEYTRSKITNRIKNPQDNSTILYWTIINNRVYILLFSIFLVYFISIRSYKLLFQWLLMSLPGVIIFLYLLIYLKITEGILIAILSSIFISAVFCISNLKLKEIPFKYFFIILLGSTSFWMFIIINRKNTGNHLNIIQTRSILKELSSKSNLLFINTKEFNDNGFYIWDTPYQFPLTNLVNKELLITNSYLGILKRFHVNDLMKSLPVHPNIFVSGANPPLLKEYYLIKYGWNVEVIKVPKFKHLEVYRVKLILAK